LEFGTASISRNEEAPNKHYHTENVSFYRYRSWQILQRVFGWAVSAGIWNQAEIMGNPRARW
jgi:hypothetical protein